MIVLVIRHVDILISDIHAYVLILHSQSQAYISIQVYTIHVHMHVRATIFKPSLYDHSTLMRSRHQVQYSLCVDEIYTCIPFTCISIHSHMYVRATIFEPLSYDHSSLVRSKHQVSAIFRVLTRYTLAYHSRVYLFTCIYIHLHMRVRVTIFEPLSYDHFRSCW